jgi:hypothetical protein
MSQYASASSCPIVSSLVALLRSFVFFSVLGGHVINASMKRASYHQPGRVFVAFVFVHDAHRKANTTKALSGARHSIG